MTVALCRATPNCQEYVFIQVLNNKSHFKTLSFTLKMQLLIEYCIIIVHLYFIIFFKILPSIIRNRMEELSVLQNIKSYI